MDPTTEGSEIKKEDTTMKHTNRPGTPSEYAAAFAELIKTGADLEALNLANHTALETKQITLEHFQAAAQVLVAEILKR